MKQNFADQDITNLVKEESKMSNYQIKTTSSDILTKFNKLRKESPVKETPKKKIPLWGKLTMFASPILAAGIIAAVVIPNLGKNSGANPVNPPSPIGDMDKFFDPSSNSTLSTELMSFVGINSSSSTRMIKRGNDEDNVSESTFIKAVNIYDKYQSVIHDLFVDSEVKSTTSNYNQEINGTNYAYVTTFSNTNVALYFNNDIQVESNKRYMEALLYTDDNYYPCSVYSESEVEEDEVEEEVSVHIRKDDKIYVLDREQEKEANEIELSYSYSVYDSESSYKADNPISKAEYELETENNIIVATLELFDNGLESEFENIALNKNKTMSFDVSTLQDEEIELTGITLTYQETSRTYTYLDYSKTF